MRIATVKRRKEERRKRSTRKRKRRKRINGAVTGELVHLCKCAGSSNGEKTFTVSSFFYFIY
jgi:hypothetical protein